MIHLELQKFGVEFLSLEDGKRVSKNFSENYSNISSIILDANNVSIITPSVMSRLISSLLNVGVENIEIINANKRLMNTFNFAIFSVRHKGNIA